MPIPRVSIGFIAGVVVALALAAGAQAADFYKGKTIRLLVGYGPGGGPDFRARLVGRHLGKYIPGHPSIIVQNMPGGGGIVATNFLFNVAKPDGLVLSNVARGPFMMQLGQRVGVKYDMPKFLWIGSLMREGNVVFVQSSLPYGSVDELKTAKRPVIFGARSLGATNYLAGKALEMLGVPLKIVVGYGTSKMNLAFEQGEIEASALGWTSIKTGRPDWVKPGGRARLIAEFGTEKTPGIQAAFGPELEPLSDKREIYALINKALGLSQANIAAPPGTPGERLEELRAAYGKMLKDAKFKADAERLNIPLRPLAGEDLSERVQDFFQGASSSARARFKKLLR